VACFSINLFIAAAHVKTAIACTGSRQTIMSNLLDEEKKSMHADEEKHLHKLMEEAKDVPPKVEETNKASEISRRT